MSSPRHFTDTINVRVGCGTAAGEENLLNIFIIVNQKTEGRLFNKKTAAYHQLYAKLDKKRLLCTRRFKSCWSKTTGKHQGCYLIANQP